MKSRITEFKEALGESTFFFDWKHAIKLEIPKRDALGHCQFERDSIIDLESTDLLDPISEEYR